MFVHSVAPCKGGLWGMAVGNHTHWTVMNSDSFFFPRFLIVFDLPYRTEHVEKNSFEITTFVHPQQAIWALWFRQKFSEARSASPVMTQMHVSWGFQQPSGSPIGTVRDTGRGHATRWSGWNRLMSLMCLKKYCIYYHWLHIYIYIVFVYTYIIDLIFIVIPLCSIHLFKGLRRFDLDWKALRGGFQSCASADAAWIEKLDHT